MEHRGGQTSQVEPCERVRHLQDAVADGERRVGELAQKLAALQAEHDLLVHSRSWRLTAPLRWLSRRMASRGVRREMPESVRAAEPQDGTARLTLDKVTPAEFERGVAWIDVGNVAFEQGVVDRRNDGRLDAAAEARVRFFREHGWLHLPGAVSAALVDKLLQDVDAAWRDRLPVRVLNSSLERPVAMSDVAGIPGFRATSVRYIDFHHASEAAAEIMMLPAVLRFAELCFDEKIAAMQTLLFENGTEQADHQDFAFVHTLRPACLLGAWVALEDEHVDAGPLFYWDRSHRAVPKYVFDTGSVLAEGDGPHVRAFERYLGDECRRRGLKRLVFTPHKGDVLIWHSALVHGGMPRADPSRTRKSIVTHYTPVKALPVERQSLDRRERNGGVYYGWEHAGHIEERYKLTSGPPASRDAK